MKHFSNGSTSTDDIDPVFKAALAHLWFVTIHPFEDGNGRIARAIADMLLARSEKSAQRFYSMSAQIRQERKAYYDILEATQKGDLDITPGWNGFWAVSTAPSTAPKPRSPLSSKRRDFWKKHAAAQPSTIVSATSSTGCSTASRAS